MNRKDSCLLVVTILYIFGVQLNLALDGYDLLCPRNDLAQITAEVRRCEQVNAILTWGISRFHLNIAWVPN
jgi:hypothetical protein